MAFYLVEVWDNAFYSCVKADSPEQAKMIAEEWFAERCPAVRMSQIQPSCEMCRHRLNDGPIFFNSTICDDCKDFDYFEPND